MAEIDECKMCNMHYFESEESGNNLLTILKQFNC